nr:hypothetical protein CFP56_56023 [Quercus suber]
MVTKVTERSRNRPKGTFPRNKITSAPVDKMSRESRCGDIHVYADIHVKISGETINKGIVRRGKDKAAFSQIEHLRTSDRPVCGMVCSDLKKRLRQSLRLLSFEHQ